MFDITLFLYFYIIQFFKLHEVNFLQSISIIYFLLVWLKISGMWTTLLMDEDKFLPERRVTDKILHENNQNLGIAIETQKSTRGENSWSYFIQREFLFFQDCNILQDPSTGLLCWYNTGFVLIKGEVLVLVNTLHCFKELAKVWFPPTPLQGCRSKSCISRWRCVYIIFKLTNTITIITPI